MSQNTPSGIGKTANMIRRLREIAESNQNQDQDPEIELIDPNCEREH